MQFFDGKSKVGSFRISTADIIAMVRWVTYYPTDFLSI